MRRVGAIVVMLAVSGSTLICPAVDPAWSQEKFEERISGFEPDDNFPDGEPPYVPLRARNALPEFLWVFSQSGWTTNQLIEALALAVTNNLSDEVLNDYEKSCVPRNAIWKLSEINHPAVTNFFRVLNDSEQCRRWTTPVTAMFHYTNLEPEVLAYMRSLCLKTNIYEQAAAGVMYDMLKTLDTMPSELKPAATNRVAKFIYFAIRHSPGGPASQDLGLARFLPAYSNSIQRLDAMRYVESTTTNARIRVYARKEADRLSALPADRLNNLPWIAEDQ